MNPYAVIGSGMGTPEAASLGVRLSVWHDAMVSHERRLKVAPSQDECDEECPHVEAGVLWAEAVATFGPRAHELTFLRSRASKTRPGSHRKAVTDAASPGHAAAPEGAGA